MKTFDGMTAFAEHLVATAAVIHETEKAILEHGSKLIEKRAKEKFGEYQNQIGPFIAWPELAESTKADRARQGYPEDEPLLRSGESRDSISRTVAQHEAQIGSNSDKVLYQELGTAHIPPRSTLGGAAAEVVPKLKEKTGELLVSALIGQQVIGGSLPIEE